MVATAPLKKSPSMKEWMAQADPPKEASTIKKMNGRLLLLSFASANVQKYNCSCKKFTIHNECCNYCCEIAN